MLELSDGNYVFDFNDCPNDVDFVNFSFNTDFSDSSYPALKICFKNDLAYNVRIFKKLIYYKKNGIKFETLIDKKKVSYIISDYNSDDILTAFSALSITDEKERIEFLYESLCNQLDAIWSNDNPCDFCDNICEGNKHNASPGSVDGCCYSFEYPKHILFSSSFTKNLQKCKFLDSEHKRCSIKNISCKLYVCSYLKKSKNFNISISDFLLIDAFFSKKQKLILQYNFFRTQEEIIDKLLEKNITPYFIYYWRNLYRISPEYYNKLKNDKKN